ncbi:MAG: RNA polymerase sigma factor [Nonlabens sp.]
MTLTKTEFDVYDLCQKGDRKAQMQVYDNYSQAMYHVALRIVDDRALAEDVMQESMITALQKMEQWNRTASFGSWLKRIVINNSLTAIRKGKRMPTVSIDDNVFHLETQVVDDIDMENAGITAARVLEVLKTMKSNYRQVLTLSLIEGMDNEEISEIMQISNGLCRTTISRAKASLRQKLTNL